MQQRHLYTSQPLADAKQMVPKFKAPRFMWVESYEDILCSDRYTNLSDCANLTSRVSSAKNDTVCVHIKTSDGTDYEKYLSCGFCHRTNWKRLPGDHSVIWEWYWICIQGVQKDCRDSLRCICLVITHTEKQTDWLDGKCEMCIVQSNVLKIKESYCMHLTSVLWITQHLTLHNTLVNSYSTWYSIKESIFSRMSVAINSDYLYTPYLQFGLYNEYALRFLWGRNRFKKLRWIMFSHQTAKSLTAPRLVGDSHWTTGVAWFIGNFFDATVRGAA